MIAAAPLTDTDQARRAAARAAEQPGESATASPRRSTARRSGRHRRRRRSGSRRCEAPSARAAEAGELDTATDEAWLIERAGGRVLLEETGAANFKVTTAADLAAAAALIGAGRGPDPAQSRSRMSARRSEDEDDLPDAERGAGVGGSERQPRRAWRAAKAPSAMPMSVRSVCDPTRVAVEADADRLPRPPAPRRAGYAAGARTSPRPTSTRYRTAADAAGIAELGIAEHIHRFAQALEIWRHPFWVEQAIDDLDAYCEFLAGSGLKVGIEADYVAGAEERIRDAAGVASVRLRDRLRPLRRRLRRSTRIAGTSGRPRATTPIASGLATSSSSPRPPVRASSTPWPIPTWSRSGARAGPGPSAIRATTTSPPSRRSPRPGSPSRSRPRGSASRSARCTRPPPSRSSASRLAFRSRSRPTPILPGEVGYRLRGGDQVHERSSGSRRSASSAAAGERREPLG